MSEAEREAKYGPLLTITTPEGPRTYRDYVENTDYDCWICGRGCDGVFLCDDREVCRKCFLLFPWNVNQDQVATGIEQARLTDNDWRGIVQRLR